MDPQEETQVGGDADAELRRVLAVLEPSLVGAGEAGSGSAETSQRYTRVALHARGGIGQVWHAYDHELGRKIALKELQTDQATTAYLRSRFLVEAQITGQLEHPGIVPVYEMVKSGRDGQPFYTMRFIEGRTLTQAVREFHRQRAQGKAGTLELRELLQAFVMVCNTLAYAHDRGVIHRDLKGANIILGPFGEVLVLDWGLAKRIGEPDDAATGSPEPRPGADFLTMPGEIMGTPGYMAPEQAEGRPDQIDVRTDVYGLGAVLYEILTDRAPFSGDSAQEVVRKVCQEKPPPPRHVAPWVPKSLEAVCLKALSRARDERYGSALELGGEIKSWLADEPMLTFREPWTQRVGRWMRRHRTLVTSGVAALLVAVVLLAGASLLLSRAYDAERQAKVEEVKQKAAAQESEAQAKESQKGAEALSRFLVDAFRRPDPTLDGRDLKVVDLLDRAVQGLEGSDTPPLHQARIFEALGETYAGLGIADKARDMHRRALEIRKARLPAEHADLFKSRNDLAAALRTSGAFAEAIELYQQVLARRKALFGAEHEDTLLTMNDLAVAYLEQNAVELARPLAEAVLDSRHRLLGPEHPETLRTMSLMAVILRKEGRIDEALAGYLAAYDGLRRQLGADHPDVLMALNNRAEALQESKRFAEAIPLQNEVLESRRKKFGPEAAPTLRALHNLATSYHEMGQFVDALPYYEEALKGRAKAHGDHPDALVFFLHYVKAALKANEALRAAEFFKTQMKGRMLPIPRDFARIKEAQMTGALSLQKEQYALAAAIWQEVLKTQRAMPLAPHADLLVTVSGLAKAYLYGGNPGPAEPFWEELLQAQRKVPPSPRFLADTLAGLGECQLRLKKTKSAEESLREALALRKEHLPKAESWKRFYTQSLLGGALLEQKRDKEAESLLREAYAGLETFRANALVEKELLPEVLERLIQLFQYQDNPAEAARWIARRKK